jgi:hypothetical protein
MTQYNGHCPAPVKHSLRARALQAEEALGLFSGGRLEVSRQRDGMGSMAGRLSMPRLTLSNASLKVGALIASSLSSDLALTVPPEVVLRPSCGRVA